MIELLRVEPARSRRPSMSGERRVTLLAIGLAALFVALSAVGFVFPHPVLGAWVPVHLLLAGAATTAISGVMPFFSAAVTGGRPAPVVIRTLGVLGVAAGTLLIVVGRLQAPALAGPGAWPGGLGGLVFIAGVIGVALATLLPLRSAAGPARIILGLIYAIALANVILGATLATLLLLGWDDVARHWAWLRAAHAWLNVFGFVSLVVAGSLLHLLPTVVGARISRTRASIATFGFVAAGPPVAALGFAVDSRIAAAVGAGLTVAGAITLGIHALNVMGKRAKWTTDPGWHRFTSWSLLAGIGWFMVGTAMAAWTTVSASSLVVGWQLGPLVAPIGIGWVAQVLIGAWSHLVPAIGPGSLDRHATQRRFLGLGATARLLAFNGGVGAMVASTATGTTTAGPLFVVGLLASVAAALCAVGLLGVALVVRVPAATLQQ